MPVVLGLALGFWAFLPGLPNDEAPNPESIVQRASPRKYRVTCSLALPDLPKQASRLVLIFPVPATDTYQDVTNFHSSGGEVLDIPGTEDQCLRYILTDADLKAGNGKVITYRYDITLFDIGVDLVKVKRILPYVETDPAFRLYTGRSGVYIDPAEPRIAAISDRIQAESKDSLDYARRCYEYVARKFSYINPGTGLHPLAQVLNDGGGDCGNLSSVFISLMRRQGIPARAAVAIDITNGADGHAWAEFYLQGYGWIPVDVTAHKESGRDYFGSRMPGKGCEWAVVSTATNPSLDFALSREDVSMLQWVACRCWTGTGAPVELGNVLYGFSVQAEPID